MIPRTYPSVYATSNGRTDMVVYSLPSISGLKQWIDYIPVKNNSSPTRLNSYGTNDAMSVSPLVSITGKKAWIDYVPVYAVANGTPWSSGQTGYIPVNGL